MKTATVKARWKQPALSHEVESLRQASVELLLAMQRWCHASPKAPEDRSHSNSRLKHYSQPQSLFTAFRRSKIPHLVTADLTKPKIG
jgi:hypothetical protein